jgi:hypothetical protein
VQVVGKLVSSTRMKDGFERFTGGRLPMTPQSVPAGPAPGTAARTFGGMPTARTRASEPRTFLHRVRDWTLMQGLWRCAEDRTEIRSLGLWFPSSGDGAKLVWHSWK